MSAALLVQVVVTGLAAGATYGLVAVGFAQLYRMTGVLQLAHGHVVAVATMVAVGVLAAGPTSPPIVLAAVVAAVTVASLLSAAISALGLGRAIVQRTPLGWVALVVAVAFALEALLLALSRRQGYAFPQILPGGATRVTLPFGAAVEGRALWQFGAGVLLALALDLFLRRTMAGRVLTAIASDRQLAIAAGLPVRRAVTLAFALAGALAAVAGLLAAAGTAVTPHRGVTLGLAGIAAAAVAGFGDRAQVFAAAMGLGVIEAAVVALPIAGITSGLIVAVAAVAVPLVAVAAAVVVRPPARALDTVP